MKTIEIISRPVPNQENLRENPKNPKNHPCFQSEAAVARYAH